VAVRMCPHCKTEIPAPEAAARSNDIVCPKCGTRLEVAPGSRTISSLCGLAAGAIAWRLSNGSPGDLGSVLPALYAFLAFGIVSALVLMFTANLRNAPVVPAPEPSHATSSAGHAAGGHGGGHH
jgi:DNA-directed RNA polymerase subunit RPC12/RpoP